MNVYSPHDWLKRKIKVVLPLEDIILPWHRKARSKCLIDFFSAKMFFTIACFLAILQAEGLKTTKKQNYLDLKATSCSININTAPNKKLEDILLGIKQQLDEIQEELRHLTKKEENNTDGKKLAFSLSSSSQ